MNIQEETPAPYGIDSISYTWCQDTYGLDSIAIQYACNGRLYGLILQPARNGGMDVLYDFVILRVLEYGEFIIPDYPFMREVREWLDTEIKRVSAGTTLKWKRYTLNNKNYGS